MCLTFEVVLLLLLVNLLLPPLTVYKVNIEVIITVYVNEPKCEMLALELDQLEVPTNHQF